MHEVLAPSCRTGRLHHHRKLATTQGYLRSIGATEVVERTQRPGMVRWTMPSERAMRAAEAVGAVDEEVATYADLIDRAADLPALEARVAELELRLRDSQHDQTATRCERDVLAKRIEAAKAWVDEEQMLDIQARFFLFRILDGGSA